MEQMVSRRGGAVTLEGERGRYSEKLIAITVSSVTDDVATVVVDSGEFLEIVDMLNQYYNENLG